MTSAPDYVFTRDFLDNNRINLQHYQWVELYRYVTHPAIPLENPDLRIADVGTGTGIWLTDLSSRLPRSVRLDGLDVSFNATPPTKWLPANMATHHWDVRSDVPDHLVGAYDIVHIRNFAFVLQDAEVESVIRNLFRLTKPGGFLQWGEPDMASFCIEKTSPENKTDAQRQLLTVSQGQDARLKPTWVPNLPSLFANGGFEHVQSDVKEAPPHLALAMHECNLVIHELVAKQTQNEVVASELRRLLPEVARETRDGAYWAFTRWVVIGQRPF